MFLDRDSAFFRNSSNWRRLWKGEEKGSFNPQLNTTQRDGDGKMQGGRNNKKQRKIEDPLQAQGETDRIEQDVESQILSQIAGEKDSQSPSLNSTNPLPSSSSSSSSSPPAAPASLLASRDHERPQVINSSTDATRSRIVFIVFIVFISRIDEIGRRSEILQQPEAISFFFLFLFLCNLSIDGTRSYGKSIQNLSFSDQQAWRPEKRSKRRQQ